MLDKYSQLKEELLKCIDTMFVIENIPGCPCEDLKGKVQNNTFNLVVLGQFKRGKTSLINALLGAEILPVAVVPLTSIATILKYGDALRIKVFLTDGAVKEIRHESLHEYVTEKGNPQNIKNVQEVVITYPSPYLKDGGGADRYTGCWLDLSAQYRCRLPVSAEIRCRIVSFIG